MQKLTIALALLMYAGTAQAQRLSDLRPAAAQASSFREDAGLPAPQQLPAVDRGPGSMAFTGAVFAAGGIFAGAVIGAKTACGGNSDSWCELGGGLIGATIGEVVMLPMGVHIAGGKVSYGRKLAVSSGVMLGGLLLAPLTGGVSLLMVPPVQLMMTVNMENRAGVLGQ
ncbi:MAG TPA: hypothetical protein VFO66_00945 [Gemmatimonadaceae bacterium]|nr:hypothetical protein [Gemmatimonadaceae bacterium]